MPGRRLFRATCCSLHVIRALTSPEIQLVDQPHRCRCPLADPTVLIPRQLADDDRNLAHAGVHRRAALSAPRDVLVSTTNRDAQPPATLQPVLNPDVMDRGREA